MIAILKNKNVLLVDDDDSNRFLISINLKEYGMNIIEAVDGIDALNKLKEYKNFDLIIMDVRMPNMNGIEVSEIIINELKLNLPIIIMSASHNNYDLNKLYEFGITSYILKPFTRKKLISIIENKLS